VDYLERMIEEDYVRVMFDWSQNGCVWKDIMLYSSNNSYLIYLKLIILNEKVEAFIFWKLFRFGGLLGIIIRKVSNYLL